MTSSMLTAERRRGTRRLTVLGKVAVPKPINLPSQRLENHGLDPNVDIVPKGTISWGSRSSSLTSNPWSSLSQSPNTDGGTSYSSHFSGRPSSGGSVTRPSSGGSGTRPSSGGSGTRPSSGGSVTRPSLGGSGTRPSTAGSDRAHEFTGASGPNSRPSSASDAVGSNQTSIALLRPHSAETRPCSSHMSRFAEASSENPVAWTSGATAEKLIIGAQGVVQYKDEGFALSSGDFPVLGSEKGNCGKNSESQNHESASRPGSSCRGVALTKESSGTTEIGPYDFPHNENVMSVTWNPRSRDNPPYGQVGAYTGPSTVSPHDTWSGIPVNNAQGGVWYRGPRGGPPYRTPPSPAGYPMEPFPYYHPSVGRLANPQLVHPTAVGPRGHHPQTDVYQHSVPSALVRPAMPIRPGFFPGPVSYEGYYGPPRGYVSKQDAAFPCFYDRYPSQNASGPDSQHSYIECGGQGLVSEKGDSSHLHDSQRSLKVLTNEHTCWDEEIVRKNVQSSFEINQPPVGIIDQPKISSHAETVDKPRSSLHEKLGLDNGNGEKPDLRRKPLAIEASLNTSAHKGTHASYPLDLRAIGYSEVLHFFPAATNDSSLIQKIEELNVKARASDKRHEGKPIYGMDEDNVKTTPVNEDCGPVYSEIPIVDGDMKASPDETSLSSTNKSNGRVAISLSRRTTRETQGRVSHRGRNLFTHAVDERPKKHPVDSQVMVIATRPETSNAHVEHPRATEERHEEESVELLLDSNVGHVQRAKMRELARQHTKQLEGGEEERARKQKAKAWAKLEELNRLTQAEAEPTQNRDDIPCDVIQDKKEETITFGAIRWSDYLPGNYSTVAQTVAHKIDKSTIHEELSVLSTAEVGEVEGGLEELVEHDQFVSLNQDFNFWIHDGYSSNLKRMGYKVKQGVQSEKKSTFDNVHEAQYSQTQVPDISPSLTGSNLHGTVNSEFSTHPRKKTNKSGKSKNKVEDGSSLSEEKNHTKSGKPIFESEAVVTSVQTLTPSVGANRSSDQLSSSIEDSQEKGHSLANSQHSHRTSRNIQGRSSEKFHSHSAAIWAPVRSINKTEVTEEAKLKNQPQSNSKSKRVEMERYIPKPVAREMSMQGSIQQPEVCSKNQTSLDGNRSHSNPLDTAGNVGSSSEARIGDSRDYKQSKSHQLWQQRWDAESKNGKQDQSGLKSVDAQQLLKVRESYSDEWNPPDGSNIQNSDSVSRGQGNTGRAKQHQFKGPRVLRNNFDFSVKKQLNRVEDEKKWTQTLGNEAGRGVFTAASKENRGFGDRSVSHWQPIVPSMPNDSQNIKNESSVVSSSIQDDQSISKTGIMNSPNSSHGGAESEKKTSIHRGWPRHNFHYEYHPVRAQGSNKSYNSDGPKDNAAFRYRESTRNNSRQGGANSRQAHIGVDISYD